ncbi:hypothetical protein MUK60_38205 [Streptomyces sp. LRE541]|uniref:DUF6875 domain-containing protein n=1 Tax=Streptomyces sp. LRE541 TaxID=2931983 RepID=UPI00200F0449|nr:hypothetical protein [Streptomyces sp. LRE541]UPZ33116.1 hypothetical protein MUK60_38205 [Streptomyces sp. LRE541]
MTDQLSNRPLLSSPSAAPPSAPPPGPPAPPGPPVPQRVLDDVHTWLTEYISRPDDRIGRPGAVCPFVAPSLKAGALQLRMCPTRTEPSPVHVAEDVRRAFDEFDAIDWPTTNSQLWCLLLAFPDLPAHGLRTLDAAHALLKSESVDRGLMIGQFHDSCTVPAVRNAAFQVSRAPVPVIAVRLMAVHDVLFLHERKEWFEAYLSRFADHYRVPERLDPFLYDTYATACATHGITP